MSKKLVHVRVLNGTDDEVGFVLRLLSNMGLEDYRFLVTKGDIDVHILSNVELTQLKHLVDSTLMERYGGIIFEGGEQD